MNDSLIFLPSSSVRSSSNAKMVRETSWALVPICADGWTEMSL